MLSYLLLSVDGEMKEHVKNHLKQFEITINEINEAKGKFNIIAKVITDNTSKLNNFISEQINSLGGINRVETLII